MGTLDSPSAQLILKESARDFSEVRRSALFWTCEPRNCETIGPGIPVDGPA